MTVIVTGNPVGSPIGSLIYPYDGNVQAVSVATHSFAEGSGAYTLANVVAVDLLNRVTAPQSGGFKIDGAGPDTVFTGASSSGLAVAVTDNESGVKAWTMQVFDANGQAVFYQAGNGPFVGTLTAALPFATYQVEIFASDEAGNESHLARTAFQVQAVLAVTLAQQQTRGFALRRRLLVVIGKRTGYSRG